MGTSRKGILSAVKSAEVNICASWWIYIYHFNMKSVSTLNNGEMDLYVSKNELYASTK